MVVLLDCFTVFEGQPHDKPHDINVSPDITANQCVWLVVVCAGGTVFWWGSSGG